MGRGQLGCGNAFLVGGIQPTVTDILHHRTGKQVGVLQHHRQATAQIVLFDPANINTIIGDGALLNIVKPIDQIGNGGLACAGGAYKCDLLPLFGVQANIMEHHLLRHIGKGHMVELHSPMHRHPAVAVLPVPPFLLPGTGYRQSHGAPVLFGGSVHHLKHPLCTGQSGKDRVHLIGDLVNGLRKLFGIAEESKECADVQPPGQGQQPAEQSDQGITGVVDSVGHRAHQPRIKVGVGGRRAKRLVVLLKARNGLVLMVKYLDDPHALNGLLNIAVHLAQIGLLRLKVMLALFADLRYRHQHNDHKYQRNTKQRRTQGNHHHHNAHKGKGGGHQLHHRLLQHHLNIIHIIGVAAHDLAVGLGVKEPQGQGLHVVKQLLADQVGGLVGDLDHHLALNVRTKGRANVQRRHNGQVTH